MKHLAILRHAKSSWGEAGLADHDRPLNKRGWKAARWMGREMADRGMRFDHVLASTAVRVRQTLDGVREGFPIDAEIDFDPRIYETGAKTLLGLVRGLPESVESSLLVGHNSGVDGLIVRIAHDDGKGFRDRVAEKFPTGALAIIELPAERWADVELGTGEVADLIFPRELD